ncbi:unnamed protein product [Peniophora sp. CBMAI 1063]|nr:unnamed protein product [Peniophora sp. CBMAI 1063]
MFTRVFTLFELGFGRNQSSSTSIFLSSPPHPPLGFPGESFNPRIPGAYPVITTLARLSHDCETRECDEDRQGPCSSPPSVLSESTSASAKGTSSPQHASSRRMPGAYPDSIRLPSNSSIRRNSTWAERRRAEEALLRKMRRDEGVASHKRRCRACKWANRQSSSTDAGVDDPHAHGTQHMHSPERFANQHRNAARDNLKTPKEEHIYARVRMRRARRRAEMKASHDPLEEDPVVRGHGSGTPLEEGSHRQAPDEIVFEPAPQTQPSLDPQQEALMACFRRYDLKWNTLKSGTLQAGTIAGEELPWPVREGTQYLQSLDAVNLAAVTEFILHPERPGSENRAPRQRVKDELVRWHPDRFDTLVLPLVLASQAEGVKALAQQVTVYLNEILKDL